MARTIIQMDDEQHRELKRIAMERHKSMSALIREAIDRVIRESVSPEEKRRRALEVVGKHRAGIRDLAEKHDQHLAEGYEEAKG